MCRYVLRGPLAKSRVECLDRNRVLLRLKIPYKSGTTHLVFTNEQFLLRLMALVPPKRMNLIRYYGVFGANHKKRKSITSKARAKNKRKFKRKDKIATSGKSRKEYRTPWAKLLKHVFKEDVLACARCAGTLNYVATINDPIVAKRILNHVIPNREEGTREDPRGPPEVHIEPIYDNFDDFTFNQESTW